MNYLENMRTTLGLFIVFIILEIGYIIYSYTLYSGPLLFMRGSSVQIGIYAIVLTLIAMGAYILYFGRKNRKEMDLKEKGLKGQASILQMQRTRYSRGTDQNLKYGINFLLEIHSPDGDIYQLEDKAYVHTLSLARLNIGTILPVYIDPDDKKNILISYQLI